MLSPSRGFCCCLPVRIGALVVTFLACLGSGILAGITFFSLAKVSARITPVQTAGFYLASVSWISLALFSAVGFISVILQHPLLLTVSSRFIIYHLPANLFCNLFFTIVLFSFYNKALAITRTPQCIGNPEAAICVAFSYLMTTGWIYLWVIVPAIVAEIYIYVMIRRFIFVVSGQWELEKDHAVEVQKHKGEKKPHYRKRNSTTNGSIGHKGRRRAKAQLWFTMEARDSSEAEDSFLPSIPPERTRSPFASRPTGLPPSPRPPKKDLTKDMPDRQGTRPPISAPITGPPQLKSILKGKSRESADISTYSRDSSTRAADGTSVELSSKYTRTRFS